MAEEQHKSLIATVQQTIGAPLGDQLIFERDLLNTKNSMFLIPLDDMHRAKISSAIRLYEERLYQQEKAIKSLQSKLALMENENVKQKDEIKVDKGKLTELELELEAIREQNYNLMSYNERQQLVNEEVLNHNMGLTNENNYLNEKALQLQNSAIRFSQTFENDLDQSEII